VAATRRPSLYRSAPRPPSSTFDRVFHRSLRALAPVRLAYCHLAFGPPLAPACSQRRTFLAAYPAVPVADPCLAAAAVADPGVGLVSDPLAVVDRLSVDPAVAGPAASGLVAAFAPRASS